MIPKIVHFIWLSKEHNKTEKYPLDVQNCINSWRERLSGYQVKEWNENNFDFSICQYANEAYKEGKYAFASDYIRLWALYNFGGIYLDTDVEILKSLDELLTNEAFMGFEDKNKIATCIIGCQKGNKVIKRFMDDYDNRRFIFSKGNYDLTPNPIPITKALLDEGLQPNGELQRLSHIVIYPMDYFCPYNPYRNSGDCFSNNTYCIHHFNGAWIRDKTNDEILYAKKEKKYVFLFGEDLGRKVCKHIEIIKHNGTIKWMNKYVLKNNRGHYGESSNNNN